jgi:ABC-2 type transport system permease protein
MAGVVFVETLRRGWRGMLAWGIGIGLLSMVQILVLPDVDSLKQFAQIVETLPAFMLQALGGGDAAFLATAEGYLAARFYSLALLIFAIYALNAGLSVTSSEEERGILDVVLSLPVSRARLVLERLAAYAVLLVGMVTITFGFITVSLSMTPVLEIDPQRIFASTLNILPGALLVLTFATFFGALMHSRGMAVAAGTVFVIGSYFISFIGASASESLADVLQVISFYAYYDSTGVMQHGLNGGNMVILLAAALVCAAGAVWSFERRDIR